MKTNQSGVRKGFTPLWISRTISVSVSWSVTGFVTYYCTNAIGLNAAIVGIMFLASKILDAITNFIVAYIVDNTHSRKGKGRPWDISVVPMWLCIILMYSVPQSWGNAAKYIMIFLCYSLVNAVFGTILGCVDNIYFKHAVFDEKKRNSVQAVNGAASTIAMVGGQILMPVLVAYFEKVPHGWTIFTSIIGIPCAVLGVIRMLTIPELDAEQTQAEIEHISMKDTVQAFISNKYVIIVTLLYFIVQVTNTFGTSPASYYFTYIVGDLSKQALVQLVSFIAVASLLICVPLANKFGRNKVLIVTFFISIAGCVMRFFAGSNMIILMASALISSICIYPFQAFSGLMLIDCMDYGEWKNKKRVEGAIFAGTGLGTTIGPGVGTALCGIVLSGLGYDGTAAVQSASAIMGIRVCYSLIPAVLLLLAVIALVAYDLDKKMPQVREELKDRLAVVPAKTAGKE